jgi:hypothetical protein
LRSTMAHEGCCKDGVVAGTAAATRGTPGEPPSRGGGGGLLCAAFPDACTTDTWADSTLSVAEDVQTIGDVPATQTAGVVEVGVCKERTYRRLVSPSSRLIRSKLEKHTQHASIGLACDE